MPILTLSGQARARLERARADAELEFLRASTTPIEPYERPGIFLMFSSVDRATRAFVITIAERIIDTFLQSVAQEPWSAEVLRADLERRLEQLITDAYAQKHSKSVTLEHFSSEMRQALRSLPHWTAFLTTLREHSTQLAELPAWAIHLQQLRDESGLSVDALADAIESDRANVNDHLWGRVKPNAKTRGLYESVLSKKLGRQVKLDA